MYIFFFFKQKTAYEMRISDWSSDVCSSDLGYTLAQYSPDTAAIDIYSLYPDNSLTRNHTQLTWQGGDWRLQLPDTPTTNLVAEVTAQIGRASCRERVCQYV